MSKVNNTTVDKAAQSDSEKPRLVTASHLAVSYPELSEFEFGLILAANAFQRWLTRCMSAAGVKDMTTLDVMVLHHVAHRDSEKRLADICFVLNIEDTHVVTYALKKLVTAELVKSEKRGKEVFYSVTKKGKELCSKYKEVRDSCLVSSFNQSDDESQHLTDMARWLRNICGRYDQASRGASSY